MLFALLVAEGLQLLDLGLEEVLICQRGSLNLAAIDCFTLLRDETGYAVAALLDLLVEGAHLVLELLLIWILLSLVFRDLLWDHGLQGHFHTFELRALAVVELIDPRVLVLLFPLTLVVTITALVVVSTLASSGVRPIFATCGLDFSASASTATAIGLTAVRLGTSGSVSASAAPPAASVLLGLLSGSCWARVSFLLVLGLICHLLNISFISCY